MRRIVSFAFSVALLFGLALAGQAGIAQAASQDGNWTVLVITEKGTCDRAYRYEVKVAGGRVHLKNAGPVDVAGTVTAAGAVTVSIKGGDKVARGTGHLSAESGAGTWRGSAMSGTCTGRWEAERRS